MIEDRVHSFARHQAVFLWYPDGMGILKLKAVHPPCSRRVLFCAHQLDVEAETTWLIRPVNFSLHPWASQ